MFRFNCDISEKACIPKSVKFPHPIGIVIGENVRIGENCVIFQNVTLGGKVYGNDVRYPKIEENVYIYPNSIIIGDVTVKKGCIIGAGSIITKDTVENGVYYGICANLKVDSPKNN